MYNCYLKKILNTKVFVIIISQYQIDNYTTGGCFTFTWRIAEFILKIKTKKKKVQLLNVN